MSLLSPIYHTKCNTFTAVNNHQALTSGLFVPQDNNSIHSWSSSTWILFLCFFVFLTTRRWRWFLTSALFHYYFFTFLNGLFPIVFGWNPSYKYIVVVDKYIFTGIIFRFANWIPPTLLSDIQVFQSRWKGQGVNLTRMMMIIVHCIFVSSEDGIVIFQLMWRSREHLRFHQAICFIDSFVLHFSCCCCSCGFDAAVCNWQSLCSRIMGCLSVVI